MTVLQIIVLQLIELVPEPVFENDGIDYMQIEGDGIEHPIFRVGDVESN